MKITLCLLAAAALSSSAIVPVSESDTNEKAFSVMQVATETSAEISSVTQDEIAPPTPADDPVISQVSPSDQAVIETESVVDGPVTIEAPAPVELQPALMAPSVMAPSVMAPAVECCTACCQPTCCCPPPPPTPTVFCLVDPCGCSYQACVRVPACCAGEQPRINWRRGILGRQIATLCWDCCGHQAEVIITCFGRVRVRD